MILERDIDARGDPQTVRVLSQAHHRNGVGGEPFVVSLFDVADDEGISHFLAMSFGNTRHEFIDRTGVLDLKLAADGVIAFGDNSWRGSDLYGPVLADAWELNDEYPW